MQERFKAYDGNKPFIFVSYAHKDSSRVYPIISRLHEEGYRIWYDEGIPPTEEWRGVINRHVLDCAVFMVFVTDSSMKSSEVIGECTFAINKRKKLHIIYLEDVPDYNINDNLIAAFVNGQRVYKFRYSESEFNRKLREPLGTCKDDKAAHIRTEAAAKAVPTENKSAPKPVPKPSPAPKVVEPKKAESPTPSGKNRKSPVFAIICALVVLAVIGGVMSGVFKKPVPYGLKYEITNGKVIILDYTGNASTLTIPSEIDGTKVTTIGGGAFYGCTGLTEIAIPDSVKYIRYRAFYGCTGLTEITIPDSVTSIGSSTFFGCTNLTEITIPDSVTSINSSTFYGCTSLTEITIPDSVKSIGEAAFSGCTITVHAPHEASYYGYEPDGGVTWVVE